MIPDLLTEHWKAFFKIARPKAHWCTCDELRRLAKSMRSLADYCERLADAGPGVRERE